MNYFAIFAGIIVVALLAVTMYAAYLALTKIQ